jgi:two-component sensor histidine kinase
MPVASKNILDGKRKPIPIRIDDDCSNRDEEFVLLREMAHRINNELTSTIGIISCAAARSHHYEVKVALAKVVEHLYDHAGVYRALQMPTTNSWIDASAFLRELCQSISRARLHHKRIELVLIEHPIDLSSAQCWRLGLIVSELITNASRHAFDDAGGTIRIELKKLGTSAEWRVTDDGSCPEYIRPGQGLAIVRQLARGLHGQISHRFGAEGAAAIVSFPIEQPMQDD